MTIYIGKNIKYLRETKKIDQQSFAEIIGVPRSTLACWENNLRTPKLEQIVKITEYFNVPLDIIYNDYSKNIPLGEKTNKKNSFEKMLKQEGVLGKEDNITEEDYNKIINFVDKNIDILINKNEKKR